MLKINDTDIKRENFMNFLGVILDESLTWNKHIQSIENKISKILVYYLKRNHI